MDRVEWLVRAVRWSIITRRQALAKKYLTPAEKAVLKRRLDEIGE